MAYLCLDTDYIVFTRVEIGVRQLEDTGIMNNLITPYWAGYGPTTCSLEQNFL